MNRQTEKKLIQALCYYILPGLALVYAIISLILDHNIYDHIVIYGKTAIILTTILLFASPLYTLFPKNTFIRTFMIYRRELGVLAFWFALTHGLMLGYYLKLYSIARVSWLWDVQDIYLYGLLAMVGMILLGITSNNASVKKLKGKWKKVQQLVYPTFILVLVHIYLVSGELLPLITGAVYIILKCLQWKKKKRMKHSTRT